MSVILSKIFTSKIAIIGYGIVAVGITIFIYSMIMKGYDKKINELEINSDYLSNTINMNSNSQYIKTNVYTNTIYLSKIITNELANESKKIIFNISNNHFNNINKLWNITTE